MVSLASIFIQFNIFYNCLQCFSFIIIVSGNIFPPWSWSNCTAGHMYILLIVGVVFYLLAQWTDFTGRGSEDSIIITGRRNYRTGQLTTFTFRWGSVFSLTSDSMNEWWTFVITLSPQLYRGQTVHYDNIFIRFCSLI